MKVAQHLGLLHLELSSFHVSQEFILSELT